MRRHRLAPTRLSWLALVAVIALAGLAPGWSHLPMVAASEVVEQEFVAALAGDEEHLLAWINLMRSHASQSPLAIQPAVQALARERSEDMARRDYFSHITPEGETIFTLMTARGVRMPTPAKPSSATTTRWPRQWRRLSAP